MEKSELRPDIELKDPNIHGSVFIASGAKVIGDVTVSEDSSIWYNAVCRGDIQEIKVGKRTNLQDGVIIHLENDLGCYIGDDVTAGHGAILHACTIEDGCLIGMGAIILNGAIIKKGAVIGAGAVVKENTIVPENSLAVGIPAKVIKTTEGQYEQNVKWASKYVKLAQVHKEKG